MDTDQYGEWCPNACCAFRFIPSLARLQIITIPHNLVPNTEEEDGCFCVPPVLWLWKSLLGEGLAVSSSNKCSLCPLLTAHKSHLATIQTLGVGVGEGAGKGVPRREHLQQVSLCTRPQPYSRPFKLPPPFLTFSMVFPWQHHSTALSALMRLPSTTKQKKTGKLQGEEHYLNNITSGHKYTESSKMLPQKL